MSFPSALLRYLPSALGRAARAVFSAYGAALTIAGTLAALGLQFFASVSFLATMVALAGIYLLARLLVVEPVSLYAKVATTVPRIVVVRAFVERRPQVMRKPSWAPTVRTAPPGSIPSIAPVEVSGVWPDLAISSNSSTTPLPPGTAQAVLSEPHFAYVEFRNESSSAAATEVAARVSFMPMVGDEPLVEMEGRWTEPEEANRRAATLGPNGLSDTLDIALKRSEDAECFAYNTENRRGSSSWRLSGRALPPGRYRVRVRLRAEGLASDYWFTLNNPGSGSDLEFTFGRST
jgi:hypothetical protein